MHTKNKNYDFIFSLGEDCACTGYLRKHHLQNASYPFDWLTGAPLENRIELFINDFKDFLNIEDLKIFPKNPTVYNDNHCDYYQNVKTQLYFFHDFLAQIPLEQSFSEVEEKYSRRIIRFNSKMKKSKKILIVWLSRDTFLSEDRILKGYDSIVKKFPNKKIDFLILENDSTKKQSEYDILNISKNIIKYTYDNASYDFSNPLAQCMGNIEASSAIFEKYQLDLPFVAKCIKILKKVILALIFIRPVRNRVRSYFKI